MRLGNEKILHGRSNLSDEIEARIADVLDNVIVAHLRRSTILPCDYPRPDGRGYPMPALRASQMKLSLEGPTFSMM